MKHVEQLLSVLVVLGTLCAANAAEEIQFRITGGDVDYEDVPVHITITLPSELRDSASAREVVLARDGSPGMFLRGQLVETVEGALELWFRLPRLEADSSHTWRPVFSARATREPAFAWQDSEGNWLDLLQDGWRLTRFMYAHDTSDAQRRFETYKPFLHVYDPDGRLLTNGPDGESEYVADQILYPHHRGIFIGWNRLRFKGKQYDLWHMSGVEQVHQEFVEQCAGHVLARTTALVHWNDDQGEPILAEKRTMTVYRVSQPTVLLLDFHTELIAVRGDVELDGDPEHAGMQYRAHSEVAAGGPDVKAEYLFHEDGIDPRQDSDLPWVAMSYGLDEERYCVQHMNHPDNPKGTIYSAYRDYGRFGAFFKGTVKEGQTMTLRYRIWIGRRITLRRDQCASRYAAFADPPQVEVLP